MSNNAYTDDERVQIAKKEYAKLQQSKEVRINNGKTTIGYVSQFNDKKTGEQSYIITHHYVPKTASFRERSKVKEVTILYRGSTGIDKTFSDPKDVFRDWGINDIPTATRINTGKSSAVSAQLKSSSDTLNNVLKDYPNAKIHIYGHSLGSMDGQYALANLKKSELSRINGAYFYQGPNIYATLSAEQKEMVQALNERYIVFNYIDKRDSISIGYGAGEPTIGTLLTIDGKPTGSMSDQHMWGGYEFDKDDNLKLDSSGSAKLAKQLTGDRLKNLEFLKNKFRKRGGSLSSAEKIYLDASEALILTEGMKLTIQSEIQALTEIFQKGKENADKLWQDTLKNAAIIGKHLSTNEILSALEKGNVTEADIRTKPKEDYEKALANLKKIEKNYDALIKQTSAAIKSQIVNDKELAAEIGGA